MDNVTSIVNTIGVNQAVNPANLKTNLYFPVESQPIQAYDDPTNSVIDGGDGFQAIVRTDTQKILAVHKQDYHLVRNEDIYPKYEDALKRSRLDLTDMRVEDEIAFDGGRSIRTYHFPAHQVEIGKAGSNDMVDLQLRVLNSYDGAYAFKSIVGAYRLICSNGMVIGNKFAETYGKHTTGIDIDKAIRKVNGAVEIFLNNVEMWQGWSSTQITDVEATRIIKALPGINERLEETLFGYWTIEHLKAGRTKWAMFQALTFWSTHATVRGTSKENSSSIILNREGRVRSVLGPLELIKEAA